MTEVTSQVFGQTKSGQTVTRYTLQNRTGLKVSLLDYGALISEFIVPDKNGKSVDIVLGFDDVPGYEIALDYFVGAICGRVANRIAGGKFTLDGNTFNLCVNDPGGCLHGGKIGYYKKMWKGEVKDNKVTFTYVSPDGEENFPGELTVKVTYSLGEDENSLRLDYEATTTKPTPVNLTSHGYFNLGGHETGHLSDHLITVNADGYLITNDKSIPTGEIQDVTNTAFDLRNPVCLGERLKEVPGGKGFDNSFNLNSDGKLALAERVEHPPTGNVLECYTTEPGLHLYTSHYFPTMEGKGKAMYQQNGSFCLEAQHHPDSIHHANFPNTVLRPGETYTQTTIYKVYQKD